MKTRIMIRMLAFLALCFACTNAEAPREASTQTPAVGSDNLALLPQESNFVMYANFEAMRQTPFGKEVGAKFEEEAEVNLDDDHYLEFLEETGFDVRKDIYEIWISSTGKKDYNEDEFGGAIIRGRFDRDRINDYLERENRYRMRKESYRGYTIRIIEESHREEFAYTFLNSETAVLGKEQWLKSVLELSQNRGSNILENPVMANYIGDIPRKQHFWGVLNIDKFTDKWAEEIRKRGSSFKGSESLENMKTFIFYTYLDRKADVNLKGIFENEEEAELFAEMLTGFKAMAKLMVSDDREAIDMLNDIRIKSSGKTISISSQLDTDFFDKIQERRRNFSDREFKL